MFHISLPIEKEGKLRFKLEFNSRSVFVKLRFGGPQSRLSEKLGGGGNAATAGAQIRDKSVREVLTELVASIDQFYES